MSNLPKVSLLTVDYNIECSQKQIIKIKVKIRITDCVSQKSSTKKVDISLNKYIYIYIYIFDIAIVKSWYRRIVFAYAYAS